MATADLVMPPNVEASRRVYDGVSMRMIRQYAIGTDQLITRMDDILDLTQDVAESIALYDLRGVTPEAKQLAEICEQSCSRVKATVALLTNVKDPAAILKLCEEIDRLESDADRVMRSAMSKLFREENDLKQVMKLRVIYDLLETITDRCEDVANIIEGIVLENS